MQAVRAMKMPTDVREYFTAEYISYVKMINVPEEAVGQLLSDIFSFNTTVCV